jgi:hypothetical protein
VIENKKRNMVYVKNGLSKKLNLKLMMRSSLGLGDVHLALEVVESALPLPLAVGLRGALPLINFEVELPVLDDPEDIPLDLLSLLTDHPLLGEPVHHDHSVLVEDLVVVQEAEDALGDQLLLAALVGVGVEEHGGPLRVEVAHALVLALLEPDQGAAVGVGQIEHALEYQDDLGELAYI